MKELMLCNNQYRLDSHTNSVIRKQSPFLSVLSARAFQQGPSTERNS